MTGSEVTVLADVRSRKSATASASRSADAAVLHVEFPRSATDDDRVLSDLVRAAAAESANVVAIRLGTQALTFGEIAASMDSLAEALGSFVLDQDSALTMALMTEIPNLCAAGTDGLAGVLGQLRANIKLAS